MSLSALVNTSPQAHTTAPLPDSSTRDALSRSPAQSYTFTSPTSRSALPHAGTTRISPVHPESPYAYAPPHTHAHTRAPPHRPAVRGVSGGHVSPVDPSDYRRTSAPTSASASAAYDDAPLSASRSDHSLRGRESDLRPSYARLVPDEEYAHAHNPRRPSDTRNAETISSYVRGYGLDEDALSLSAERGRYLSGSRTSARALNDNPATLGDRELARPNGSASLVNGIGHGNSTRTTYTTHGTSRSSRPTRIHPPPLDHSPRKLERPTDHLGESSHGMRRMMPSLSLQGSEHVWEQILGRYQMQRENEVDGVVDLYRQYKKDVSRPRSASMDGSLTCPVVASCLITCQSRAICGQARSW